MGARIVSTIRALFYFRSPERDEGGWSALAESLQSQGGFFDETGLDFHVDDDCFRLPRAGEGIRSE
jgi:hypothetical protein